MEDVEEKRKASERCVARNYEKRKTKQVGENARLVSPTGAPAALACSALGDFAHSGRTVFRVNGAFDRVLDAGEAHAPCVVREPARTTSIRRDPHRKLQKIERAAHIKSRCSYPSNSTQ